MTSLSLIGPAAEAGYYQPELSPSPYHSATMWYLFALLVLAALQARSGHCAMPAPFYRELYCNMPSFSGADVRYLQQTIARCPEVNQSLVTNGNFDSYTQDAVSMFQALYVNGLNATGYFDEVTANTLLQLYGNQ